MEGVVVPLLNLMTAGAQLFGRFNDFVSDDELTANEPFTFTTVNVGTGAATPTTVSADSKFGKVRLTGGGNEDDGHQFQDERECFRTDEKEVQTVFACRIEMSDPTQSDLIAGLCVLDTTLIASNPTDGIYFRKDDGDNQIDVVSRLNGSEDVETGVFSLDTESHELSFTVIPAGDDSPNAEIHFHIDNRLVKKLTTTKNPHDEALSRSIAFLAGAAGAPTCDVDYVGAWHVGPRSPSL